MSLSEIINVDVVPDRGSNRHGVVGPKDLDVRVRPERPAKLSELARRSQRTV